MGALMPEYLRVVNKQGETLKIIQPINFSCSLSLSYEKNSMSFSMPLDEEMLELNSIVIYHAGWTREIFGGHITIIDIDEENRVVNYTGDSWTGMVNDYIIEIGSSDRTVRLYSEETYPGDQNDLNSSRYPNNGIYPFLHYVFETFDLELEALTCDVVDIPRGQNEPIKIKLGSTLADALKAFTIETELIPRIHYEGRDNGVLSFWFVEATHHGQVAGVEHNIVPPYSTKAIYTKATALTARFDGGSVHYYANDDTYKSKSSVYSTGMPTDMAYNGIDMVSEWKPNDNSGKTNRSELKYERESAMLSKISSEITLPFGYSLGIKSC